MDEQKQEEQPAEASTRLSPPEERHQAEHERVREPSPYQTVMLFADQLGETEEGPRKQLVRLVQALGRTQTRTLLENPLRIEEGSGLMPDGSRRRTPGGVFFYLAYTISRPKEGKKLSRSVQRPPGAEVQPRMEQTKQVLSLSPLFNWEDRIAVIDEIAAEKGTATTVKITLRGTMGKYVDEGACIVGVMQHTGEKLPTLPAGPTRCATRWSPQAEKWQS